VRIGVDGKPLMAPRAGVARYLEGVLGGVAALAPSECEVSVVSPAKPRRTLPWVLWDLQRATAEFSVFHFPFYYPPLFPRCPATVAIHDMLFLTNPEWFLQGRRNPLRWMVPRGARAAAAIVTFSEATVATICDGCRVPASRVHVIPHGVDGSRFRPPDPATVLRIRRSFGLDFPYLLQLGALDPRRGTDLAIVAVGALRQLVTDLELVLVGEQRGKVEALASPPAWVRRLGHVDDNVLPALMVGASAVLAPSRGEGFDLPVLEALACGAAVVASDIQAHVEHFGCAVELFANGDAEALEAATRGVLESAEREAELRAAGPQVAGRFRWEDSAERHLELWRQVAR